MANQSDNSAKPLKSGSNDNFDNKGSEKAMPGEKRKASQNSSFDLNGLINNLSENEHKKSSAGKIIIAVAATLIAIICFIGLKNCNHSDETDVLADTIVPVEEVLPEPEPDLITDIRSDPDTEAKGSDNAEKLIPVTTPNIEEISTDDKPNGASDEKYKTPEIKEVVVETPPTEKPVEKKMDDNKVYDVPDIKPQFPGGDTGLYKYLGEHIIYPVEAQEEGISGRVVVQFVVTKEGKVGDVKVLRGKHPALDKEAVRVVKSLPAFKPGLVSGHPVNCWYTLPITFRLQ